MYGDDYGSDSSFYVKWYSHLNCTSEEFQKMAVQLWYWRERIREVATIEYPISRYCLDIKNNSLILVSTFNAKDKESNPFLVDLNLAQSLAQGQRLGNLNEFCSACGTELGMPSELWIRWKSNPIAMPAFDVYYDLPTGDEGFDKKYRTSSNVEMGQVTHTNNDCNDLFKLVLSKWRDRYGEIIDWGDKKFDENSSDVQVKNRLPVFFDMEQSANVLALASWYSIPDVDEDGIVKRDEYVLDRQAEITCSSKNPLHILSIEEVDQSTLNYNYVEYGTSSQLNQRDILVNWNFDKYHYCSANGSLLVPFYKFDCSDESKDEFRQKIDLMMFLVNAQTLKLSNFSAQDKMSAIGRQPNRIQIDLNELVDAGKFKKYRFDHPLRVCRNTNVVFSPYEVDGMNKVKCAFLGTFIKNDVEIPRPVGDIEGEDEQAREKVIDDSANGYNTTAIKRSSCNAMTRYEFDSMSAQELSMTKAHYFKGDDGQWEWDNASEMDGNLEERRYVDTHMLKGDSKWRKDSSPTRVEQAFNSYDSNDKFVFVIDFQPNVDNASTFNMSWRNGLAASSYNILSDSGYIPHFANQSTLRYSAPDGGTAYTWGSEYLKDKEHLQFELLGLDDKSLPSLYKEMLRMVVDDTTDDCKTLICPTKFMDDIYRIWCENEVVKTNMYIDEYGKFENHFKNEYKQYVNGDLEFGNTGEIQWVVDEREGFEVDLNFDPTGLSEDDFALKLNELLKDYYVCVVRSDERGILNEKRYLLQPTSVSDALLGTQGDGFVKCNLSKYQTPLVQNGGFNVTQVLFTGTQNPFNYDETGQKIHSIQEEMQYGNSIKGVDGLFVKVDVKRTQDGRVILVPTAKFVKNKREDNGSMSLIDMVQRDATKIGAGQVTIIFSYKNPDNIAKYHILNRRSSLYFNGSLPKNGKNQYKFSDFKFSTTVKIEKDGDVWKSVRDDGATLAFTEDQVVGANGDS